MLHLISQTLSRDREKKAKVQKARKTILPGSDSEGAGGEAAGTLARSDLRFKTQRALDRKAKAAEKKAAEKKAAEKQAQRNKTIQPDMDLIIPSDDTSVFTSDQSGSLTLRGEKETKNNTEHFKAEPSPFSTTRFLLHLV
ncbi:hypothetical protein LTR84_010902 [Exophiala bonariae]|uniref:Uncharacterized protein n=1 Tax=Exophiala bonariae TaxID=1690606 RepID=A0AAV9NLC4_9EURO|nr:hypothetical protein LTR84_010902 [Exophiala bonariae]